MRQENERNKKVQAVLAAAVEPIGPSEIARRIGEEWCNAGATPKPASIIYILRRIHANKHGRGRYSLRGN